MRIRSLGIAVLAALIVACGATNQGGARPITNPLQERTAVVAGPPVLPPEAGSLLATPAAAAPGSATDPEGASVRAIEYLAELLAVPPRELRPESVTRTAAWRVVLRDAFSNAHTVDVSEAAVAWVGQTRAEGVLVARDEAQRLVVVQTQGQALTLRLSKAGTGPSIAIRLGTPVSFAYDSSPRGDGVPVLAWLEPR